MADHKVNTPVTSPALSDDEQDWSQDIEEGSVDAEDEITDSDYDADATTN